MLSTKLPLFSLLLQLCEINDPGLSSLELGFVDSVAGHKQQIRIQQQVLPLCLIITKKEAHYLDAWPG
jgi:hypothetical protein